VLLSLWPAFIPSGVVVQPYNPVAHPGDEYSVEMVPSLTSSVLAGSETSVELWAVFEAMS